VVVLMNTTILTANLVADVLDLCVSVNHVSGVWLCTKMLFIIFNIMGYV